MKKTFWTFLVSFALIFSVSAVDIRFSWDFSPVDEQVIEYRLYEVQGNTTNLLASVNSDVNTVVVNDVSTGRHNYELKSFNFWGESVPAQVSTPVTPNKPLNVNITKEN